MAVEYIPAGNAGGPPNRGFYTFSVTFDSPKAAATDVVGAFAVSRLTGDVWETNLCKRYAFPALRAAQRRIMARTHGSFRAETAARQGLGCP